MKTQFTFIDPGAIMGVIVACIVLGVGVFAYFIAANAMSSSYPSGVADGAVNKSRAEFWYALNNSSTTGGQIFNILGVVLIIGAIMAIVGLVYNYVR